MIQRTGLLAMLVLLLCACGGGSPEPTAAGPAPPAEPQIDRLTLLREAQARTKMEREKRRDAMRAVGNATVTKKKQVGKKKEDVKLELEFEFTNLGAKELSAAEGALEFRDKAGTLLKSLKVPFQGPIKTGQKAQKHGMFPVDPIEEGDVALVKAELAELTIVWVPKRYRFSDGTDLIGE